MGNEFDHWNRVALDMKEEEEAKKKQAEEDARKLKEALTIRGVVSSVRAGKTVDFNELLESAEGKGQPVIEQQAPKLSINSQPVFSVLEKVLKELSYSDTLELVRARMILGKEKYGVELHSFNGRNARQDAQEEILDCLQYVTQLYMEQTASDVLAHSDKARMKRTYKNTVEHLLEVLFNIEDGLEG